MNWQLFMWHVLIGRFGFGIYISDFVKVYNRSCWEQIISFGWGYNIQEGDYYSHLYYKILQEVSLISLIEDNVLRLGMSGLM